LLRCTGNFEEKEGELSEAPAELSGKSLKNS